MFKTIKKEKSKNGYFEEEEAKQFRNKKNKKSKNDKNIQKIQKTKKVKKIMLYASITIIIFIIVIIILLNIILYNKSIITENNLIFNSKKNNRENYKITTEVNNNNNFNIIGINDNNKGEIKELKSYNKSKSTQNIFEAVKIGREYLKKCIVGTFNYDNIVTDIENPKISVIIPVYNADKTIKHSIRSVQRQTIQDIEIILVNDYSEDKSLELIEEMKKEDKRIKIINNNKNMGILYSRCVGTLMAKGEYIFPLDNDDMFLVGNILKSMYHEAKKDNFDTPCSPCLNKK